MNRSQLADVMLKGRNTFNIREYDHAYICVSEKTGLCRACALGCAFIGKLDGDYVQAEEIYRRKDREGRHKGAEYIFAELLDIGPDLAFEIEGRHLDGQTVEEIAAWLKSSEQQE